MALYVSNVDQTELIIEIDEALQQWQQSSKEFKKSMESLFEILKVH
jgi:hypothetical protein